MGQEAAPHAYFGPGDDELPVRPNANVVCDDYVSGPERQLPGARPQVEHGALGLDANLANESPDRGEGVHGTPALVGLGREGEAARGRLVDGTTHPPTSYQPGGPAPLEVRGLPRRVGGGDTNSEGVQMADITTPRDLFLHELGDILYVEEKLTEEVLPKLINEVQSAEFRKSLERHLEQTKGHVTNLEQVFEALGEQSDTEKCLGFEGLRKEHDEMIGEVSDDLIDLVDAGAAARTEHYEIAAYAGLIEMARALGETDAVSLLDENLKEEKEALREVESVTKKLRDEQKALIS